MHNHHEHAGVPKKQLPYLIGIILNSIFIIAEMIFAYYADSTALFADALHSISDVASLILAWAAVAVFGLRATSTHTYGWHNATILASFMNALFLLGAVFIIWFEAIDKLLNSNSEPAGSLIMIVSAIGIVINFLAAKFFAMAGDHEHDINAKGAYVHLLADAGVSFGVVLSGLLTFLTDWYWLDPVVSILIGVVIIVSSWGIFKQSILLIFNGVPENIDEEAVENAILATPQIISMHDLHIWGLSTTETALTVHLVVENPGDMTLLSQLGYMLQNDMHIQHTTIQLEKNKTDEPCNTI
jgi:cobalt-zinc-cadmium efflux system protein